MNRRIPNYIECKIIGRYRLLPEVVETLDFNAKAAYKLRPNRWLKKTGYALVLSVYSEKLRRLPYPNYHSYWL